MSRPAKIQPAILQLLQQHHALTATELGCELVTLGHPANKTSIYRALEKLLRQGKICRLDLGQGEFKYEQRADHHDHAVCTRCGRVQIVDCHRNSLAGEDQVINQSEEPKANLVPLADGFTVDHHHLTFFGHCARCQVVEKLTEPPTDFGSSGQ